MEQGTTIPHSAGVKEAPVLVLEAVDQKPSGFIMDGPGMDDFDQMEKSAAISAPSIRFIRRESRRTKIQKNAAGEEEMVYEKIRYINGCPFIEKERQDREGWKPNPIADMIVMKAGTLRVIKSGDIGKYLYLEACEYNENAFNRPDDAETIFRVINTLIDAQADESTFDKEAEAMAILMELKTKVNGKEHRYNEDQLEFLCGLFKIASPEAGYGSEAWVKLATVAKANPEKFLSTVQKTKGLIEADVFSALQLKVVEIDEEKAFFSSTNFIIMRFDRDDTKEEQKGLALIDFMSNPKNKKVYDTLRVQLKAKKDLVMQPIT